MRIGLADMRHDLADLGYDEMSRWEKVSMWARFYFRPTRGWLPKVEEWWLLRVRRYPPPPPLDQCPVALHFGFVEGVPPCTDGPVCSAHDWRLSPLVTGERDV